MRKIIVFFIVFALVLLVMVLWIKRMGQQKSDLFQTTEIAIGDVTQHQYISGTISSLKEVEIVPHISGIVEKLFIETGQSIKQGQPIARIKLIASPGNKENAKANLKLATLKYELASKKYQRSKDAFLQEVISKNEFDQMESEWMQAHEEFATATKQMEIADKGYIRGDFDISDVVRSTIDGTVVDVPAKEGSSVVERNNFNSGTVIATISDMGNLIFKGKIGEREIQHLKLNMSFSVRIPALDNTVYPAKLSYIGAKGIDDNGVIRFDVEGTILPKQGNPSLHRTGYSGVAQIVLAKAYQVFVVNEKNIIHKDSISYVEVLENDKKRLKKVAIGVCDGIYCEIKRGLSKTDKIIEQK